MDTLPELALLRIFSHLPVYDRLAARLVCKEWRRLVEEQLSHSAKELVLFYWMRPRPVVWHYSGQPVNLDNAVTVNPKFRSSASFKRLFRSIQRLYIAAYSGESYSKINTDDELEWDSCIKDLLGSVNCFTDLEHFELNLSKSFSFPRPDQPPFKINLKKLKTFHYETDLFGRLASVRSAKLEHLAFFDHLHMNANFESFRNSLKVLKVYSFSCQRGFELPNLQQLFFSRRLEIQICSFKKLREVHFYYLDNQSYVYDLLEIKTIFEDLFEQRSRFERKLLVYFDGNRCEPDSLSEEVAKERIMYENNLLGHVRIRKTDLQAFMQNKEDFRLQLLRKHLDYTNELDDVIAAMSEGQIERLARSLEAVSLFDQPSSDPLLFSKLRDLFRYVQFLCIPEKCPRDWLDLLPGLLPNLVSLLEIFGINEPYPPNVSPLRMPSFLVSKFKGLKNIDIAFEPTPPNDFKRILDRCRYFSELYFCDPKIVGVELAFFMVHSDEPGRYYLDVSVLSDDPDGAEIEKWTPMTRERMIEYLLQKGILATD